MVACGPVPHDEPTPPSDARPTDPGAPVSRSAPAPDASAPPEPEAPRTPALERAAKARPRSEYVMRIVQPAVRPIIAALARWGVNPLAVVLAHTLLGLIAAVLVAAGGPGALDPAWIGAAVLLQVKTMLDNTDGGLARATGQVTEMGRYLDTVMDLVGNAAIFAALAVHGPAVASGAAFVVLMLVLSWDHNLERRYREARGAGTDPADAPPGAPKALLVLVRGVYRTVLAPQDRLVARVDDALLGWARGGRASEAPPAQRRAWSDLFSTASVVDLGLSTQLLVLGLALVAGKPFAYVWIVVAQAAYLVCVQLLRVARFRRYARTS